MLNCETCLFLYSNLKIHNDMVNISYYFFQGHANDVVFNLHKMHNIHSCLGLNLVICFYVQNYIDESHSIFTVIQ